MRSAAALATLSVSVSLAAGCVSAGKGRPAVVAPSVPSRVFWVDGPRGRLRVDDGGSASGEIPVLLVHGNGGNRSQWTATLEHLRASRRAAAFDLGGYGESEAPPAGDLRVEDFAADVAAVANQLGLRRFVLVGHSYGGAVVAAYAGLAPDRLAGLVFADCGGDLHDTPPASLEPLYRGLASDYEGFTQKWFEGILEGARPETRAAVLDSLRRTRRDMFVAATKALYRFELDAALARYPGPKLSIASYLYDKPAAIHRKNPAIPVRRIEGASHWLMMDRPQEFDRILDEFLASLPR